MDRFLKIFMIAFLVAGLLATPSAGAEFAQAQGAGVNWEVTIAMDDPDQVLFAQETGAELTKTMQAGGVTANLSNDQLKLTGQQGFEQLRNALFDTSAPWVDFLGGPVELTLSLPDDGKPVTLHLETRIASGYRWEVLAAEGVRYAQGGESVFGSRYRGYGAPAVQTIQLAATGTGESVAKLIYRRPFGPDEAAHAWLNIQVSAGYNQIEISDPSPAVLDSEATPPPADTAPNPLETLVDKALPASWDWRAAGIVPAPRDQRSCGSCWAFGTVGIMESAIAKSGGPLTDISEQFLISCNTSGWGCGGGLTAHKWHYNTLAINQIKAGAVLESSKPYTATNGSCTVTYNPPYRLSGWKFISGSEWIVGSVEEIKNAIYTYGPITAGVCAGPAFDAYTGGVFATEEAEKACDGYTNHQIILVGWDDATGSWILRNSWGPYWGEDGYMRIAWDTSRVGEGTSWVTWGTASLAAPTTYRPTGETYSLRPMYAWARVSSATSYSLQVHDIASDTYPVDTIVSDSVCSSATKKCSYTPKVDLTLGGNYEWRVASIDTSGTGPYSAFKPFTPLAGFRSSFNGAAGAAGWVKQPGGAWKSTTSTYYTTGATKKYSSASYDNQVFGNFTYEARVKNSSMVYPAGLVARGTPGFAKTNDWRNAYEFFYSNDGKFSVWRGVNGKWKALKPWASTSAIKPLKFNTLKVIADGSQLLFYINNTLVWKGRDATFASGQVGVIMYRGSLPARFDVDWARLGMSELYKASSSLEKGQVEYPNLQKNQPVIP
ncbi:MAG: DUF1080 domain-containing protein [Chloroflexi bacterium]|nr:MAG: DUF1080 domain-containing protein [Chloroflexota bacterium]